jgi:hypothetical protein
MDRSDAHTILQQCGAPIGEDFHRLSSGVVERLLERADAWKYRKPRNANGSRARYFHAYLQRLARRANTN